MKKKLIQTREVIKFVRSEEDILDKKKREWRKSVGGR
jgi:hypothetical protein